MRTPRWFAHIEQMVCVSLSTLSLAGVAHAQLRVDRAGPIVVIRSEFPRSAAVMYRSYQGEGQSSLGFTSIGASASVELRGIGGQVDLERLEILDPKIGLRARPPAECVATAGRLDETVAALERQAIVPLEGSQDANAAIEAATELAQLHLERTRDSLNLKRYSMTALVERVQSNRNASAQQLAKQVDEDAETQREETIQDIAYAALAYSEAASAKYEILARDAKQYRALLDSSSSALRIVRARLNALDAEERDKSQFNDFVVRQLAAGMDGAVSRVDVDRRATANRACATAAGIDDQIILSSLVADSAKALAIEVRFDNRAKRTFLIRRVVGSDDWIGTITWPTSANSGRVAVISPRDGRRVDVAGTLDAHRPSLRATEQSLARDVEKAKKRFAEAKFRADGADHVKAVVIP